jgi:hypothetical protein
MLQRHYTFLKKNYGAIALIAMLAASVTVNVFLGVELRKNTTIRRAGVQVGARIERVPIIEGGTPTELTVSDKRWTVLYIMSPTCRWCARNLEAVRALGRAAGSRFDFVGISITTSKLDSYLATTPLPFRVNAIDVKRPVKNVETSVTPQTVVLRPGGVVDRVWVGAYLNATQKEIESYFGVSLPTVSASEPTPSEVAQH